MALVSQHSGLPVSSIYWHFGSKGELIAEVIRRSHEEWLEGLGPLPELPPDSQRRDLLTAILHHEVAGLMQHPEFLRFGLMLALEQRPEEPTARALFLQMRTESLTHIVDGLQFVLDLEGIADSNHAPELGRLIMASIDGLFVASRASDSPIDIAPHLDLLAEAVDLLIDARSGGPGDREENQ